MGHASLTMTMRYTHLSSDALRDAIGALERPRLWATGGHDAITSTSLEDELAITTPRDYESTQPKNPAVWAGVPLVLRRGLEPPRGCPRQHLKLVRIPFRHLSMSTVSVVKRCVGSVQKDTRLGKTLKPRKPLPPAKNVDELRAQN